MSTQAALQFINQVRTDQQLQDQVKALGPKATLADFMQLGAAHGFGFTIEALQLAHKHDWSMRWVQCYSLSELRGWGCVHRHMRVVA